jgi:hypothetical protein
MMNGLCIPAVIPIGEKVAGGVLNLVGINGLTGK